MFNIYIIIDYYCHHYWTITVLAANGYGLHWSIALPLYRTIRSKAVPTAKNILL